MKSLLVLVASIPLIASAHEVRQQGPHVHGQADVQIGVEGSAVEVRLQAPGMGILTFERPPTSDPQAAELKRAISVLDSGKWVEFPQAAGCSLTSHMVQAEGFSPGAGADHHHAGHEHAEHAEHDHAHHHAGFQATLSFRCKDASKLTHLQVGLASQFPNLHQTIVESATPRGQDRVVLQGQQRRVELTR